MTEKWQKYQICHFSVIFFSDNDIRNGLRSFVHHVTTYLDCSLHTLVKGPYSSQGTIKKRRYGVPLKHHVDLIIASPSIVKISKKQEMGLLDTNLWDFGTSVVEKVLTETLWCKCQTKVLTETLECIKCQKSITIAKKVHPYAELVHPYAELVQSFYKLVHHYF